MPKLFQLNAAKQVTITYDSSQTVTLPSNVVRINIVGRGGSGTPAKDGYYSPGEKKSTYVTSVRYESGTSTFASPGTWYWENCQQNGKDAANNINQGNVSYIKKDYVQYDNGFAEFGQGIMTSGNPIPGSAYTYTSDAWKTSGPIVPGDFAFMYVAWQEYGPYNPPVAATTGGDTTGFGKVFPGGVGGLATQYSYNDIAVTSGTTYQLTIPSGGFITVSYWSY